MDKELQNFLEFFIAVYDRAPHSDEELQEFKAKIEQNFKRHLKQDADIVDIETSADYSTWEWWKEKRNRN